MQNSDYIAISSAVIALLAMGATIWQAWVTRKHNYLSVRPLLVWYIERKNSSDGAELICLLRNKGIGPAIVTDRYFTINGQRFKPTGIQTDEALQLVQTALGQKYKYDVKQWGLPGKNSAILSQEEVSILHLSFSGMSHETLSLVMESMNYINFHLDYESLYGHKWKLTTDDLHKES